MESFDPESLDIPPSREFEETAALLAYAAPERKPPESLKARLMASVGQKPSFVSTYRRVLAAGACAAVMLIPYILRSPSGRAVIVASRGEVMVDGGVAPVGATLVEGQTITVSGDGEAIVRLDGRAGFKLSHGAKARLSRIDKVIEVRLIAGWILSAVKTGVSYTIETDKSSISALGTDFIVKVAGGGAYTCICHGRLGLTGFPEETVSSEHHHSLSQPSFPADAAVGMAGHSDQEIASLRVLLDLARPQ